MVKQCLDCDGTGEMHGSFTCDHCNGTGTEPLTIEQMIEEMPNTHICPGGFPGGTDIWWAYIEPWGVIEDGKGGSPSAAVRALYEKWKITQ